ncbi:hypothetical protein [Stutzerimonas nitrititolerans]|uniref:hypothetical protein n=1 Tax=Stutzerimonas nitrititolerans TaxID=2482751 RepID=UPI00289724B4|nr:hypothetical protein [Stutzerimonas nitrititolerans]
MDDQFKNLKFDMDEEIQEREARASVQHRQPIDTGHAIIIAAIILVVGIWGGKLYYDYVQEQRAIAALQYFSNTLNSSMQESNRRSQQYAKESAARQQQQTKQAENKKAAQLAQMLREKEQLEKETKLLTPKCRFWRDQYESNPTERAANEYRKACGY